MHITVGLSEILQAQEEIPKGAGKTAQLLE